MASTVVRNLFDDDLDADNGDAIGYGVGPILSLSDGVALSGTSFRGSQLISVPDPRVYKPALRSNLANELHGDMVAGNYSQTATQQPEHSDYSRDDYEPTHGGSAFLVRLRRTHEEFDSGSETSSAGPAIPFLFGRGSVLNLDNRASGTSVRGTVIAQAQRVLSVGAPHVELDPPVPGLTPFVLFGQEWQSLPPVTFVTLTFQPSGIIERDGMQVGYFVAADSSSVTSVGQSCSQTPAPTTAELTDRLSNPGYVPIIPNDASTISNTVVGFGYLEIDRATISDTGVQVRKHTNRIAAFNASAALARQLPEVFSNEPQDPDLQTLFEQHRAFLHPLRAPALVR
jgi:hypothetical protein